MMKRKVLSFLCVLLCLALTGCKIETQKVVYTVYPVGYILDRLGGDKIVTESIQSDEIVQRAQIKSNYVDILKNAELFLYIGDLEPYMSIYRPEIRELVPTIDLSAKSSIYQFKRYTRVVVDDVWEYLPPTDYYKGDAMKMIDTNNNDLYLWLDPIAMVSMSREIKGWLQTNFAEQATYFENNFSKLESDLIQLDAEYQSLSTRLKQENKTIKFVSMTASFGNWQRTYGFQVYPIILSKYGVLPNPEQLEIIKQRIITDEVKYIIAEQNMSDDMSELCDQLVKELGLTMVQMSNLSSLSNVQKEENSTYLSIMYDNLSQLEIMASDNTDSDAIIEELTDEVDD